MSFFRKLFGGAAPEADAPSGEEMHEGYRLTATPQKDGGQYRLCGTISREVDGTEKSHRLIRADLFTSSQEAGQAFFRKARLVIREQGERLFD
ncbi:MAG: HlyU family transcriptional regulator [Nitratireductor sp.]